MEAGRFSSRSTSRRLRSGCGSTPRQRGVGSGRPHACAGGRGYSAVPSSVGTLTPCQSRITRGPARSRELPPFHRSLLHAPYTHNRADPFIRPGSGHNQTRQAAAAAKADLANADANNRGGRARMPLE
jgi:hypothetical protein